MEMIYSRELGISVVPNQVSNADQTELSLHDALDLYQRLKGAGKTKLFFEGSERSIRYLKECLGHDRISSLEPSDAGVSGTSSLIGVCLHPQSNGSSLLSGLS